MTIIVYDTFNEYIASTSYKTDDLCFIKELGAWYQGGRPKQGKVPYPGCNEHHCDCNHGCDCDCCPPPFPKELSVINIDGVAYWAWRGILVKDSDGNFVKVYKTQDFSNFATKDDIESLKAYIDAKFAALAKIRVNGVLYDLNDGGIIDIVTDNTVSVQYNLTHAVSSNKSTKIVKGSAFETTITAETGYTLGTVTYTMGGSQYTATAGKVSIANVTGDIVINASASIATYTVTWKAGTGCSGTTITEAVNYGTTVYASKHDSEFTVNTGYENPKWDKASAVVTSNVTFTKTATAVVKTFNIYYGMNQDASTTLLPDLTKSVSTTAIASTKIDATTSTNGDYLHLWIPSDVSVSGYHIVYDRDNMESLQTVTDFVSKGTVQINGENYTLYYSGSADKNPDPTFKAGFTKKIILK